MDKRAVLAAQQCLANTENAVRALQSAKDHDEFELAWANFLVAANRVYSKLEQGAKINGKSSVWFGIKKKERKTDPLLKYLHHARNADEHGLTEVVRRTASSFAFKGGHIENMIVSKEPGGRFEIEEFSATGLDGSPAQLLANSPGIKLIRVRDRGEWYDPPSSHLGRALAQTDPLTIANACNQHLHLMVDEARELVAMDITQQSHGSWVDSGSV